MNDRTTPLPGHRLSLNPWDGQDDCPPRAATKPCDQGRTQCRGWPFSTVWLLALCGATLPGLAMMTGCQAKPATDSSPAPLAVEVSEPIEREVTDYAEFVGRTEAPDSVEIRARVTGYLVKMPFTEGTTVKAGDLLFAIDDRPYKDDLDQAQASLDQAKAGLVKAQGMLNIGLETQRANAGAISQQDLVQRQGGRDEAAAAVQSAQATLERCKLNLQWCQVTSPIDGRVSRYYKTLGNLVTQDTTLLTTVVSEDPIYAYFDVDERTMLRIIRHLMPNQTDLLKTKQVPILMGLADEEGFPHVGYLDFADNVVHPGTGTISARAVFGNPPSPSGRRLLRPGMFVRISLPLGKPHSALLVSEKAISTDQGQRCVYVVDGENRVQYRRVQVGAAQADGLRVIEDGLQQGDLVLVSGLQLVRPHMEVSPQLAPMAAEDPSATPTSSEPAKRAVISEPVISEPVVPGAVVPGAAEPGASERPAAGESTSAQPSPRS